MFRADFYVLAGEVAVENGLVNAKVAEGVCSGYRDCRREVAKVIPVNYYWFIAAL